MLVKSVDQALAYVDDTFKYEVEKRELTGPGDQPTNLFGLFRSDTGEHIGTNAVSDMYEPHRKQHVLDAVGAVVKGFEGAPLSVTAKWWRYGHNIIIGPTEAQRKSIMGTKDNLFPRFVLRAGYDASAWSATFGAFRDMCLNMMMLKPSATIDLKARHYKSTINTKVPEMIEDFRDLSQGWEDVTAVAEQLQQKRVDMKAFIEELYPLPEEPTQGTVTRYTNRVEAIMQRIALEHRQVESSPLDWSKVTGWQAFNGVQGYVQHETGPKKADAVERALRVVHNADINKALDLALAM